MHFETDELTCVATVNGAQAEMPPMRTHRLRPLFLKKSKTIEEAAPPSCSLSCYFTSCSALRNQLRGGCKHLQAGRNEHFWLLK